MADPFAEAGFAPAGQAQADADPFAAAGFAPAQQPQAPSYGIGSFANDVVGSTAAALHGLRHGMAGNLPTYMNAAIGTPLRMVTGMQGPGAAFQQGVDAEKVYDKEAAKYPIANIGGTLTGALGGALATSPAMSYKAASTLPELANYAARNGAYGSGIGWLNGNTPQERIEGAQEGLKLGVGLAGAGPLMGRLLQAPVNAGKSVVNTARNLFSAEGRDATAGQVLREAAGDFTNQAARSPIADLELRTAQSTGNPGLAALERTLGSEPGALGNTAETIVQYGRTPEQAKALARSLVGSDAGMEPATLTAQTSAKGVQAIQEAHSAAKEVENDLWQAPALQGVKLNADRWIKGVNSDIERMPPSFRLSLDSGPLGALMADVRGLPQGAGIADVNAIRSRILEQGRSARAAGDNVSAGAAEKLADSLMDRTQNALLGPGGDMVRDAWNAARDFTRQRAQAFGHSEFDSILRPNKAGNMRANDETAFGRFFDVNGGTDTGLGKLQGVSTLLRTNGASAAADTLDEAARAHVGPSILRQSLAGSQRDATGAPALNVNDMTSAVNRMMPALNSTPMTRALAGEVQASGNAAELLGRPAALRGDMNSTTFEKLRNRDLVSAVLGQAGSSSAGALGGGYAGYKYGPDDVPAPLRILGGAAAGAAAGSRAAPYVGSVVSKIPGVSALMNGPANDVMKRVGAGLASPDEYKRLLLAKMLQTPGIMDPGMLSIGAPTAARAALTYSGGR